VGSDFETRRAAVESVSVLFDLFDGDGVGYPAGLPGERVPSGWLVSGAKSEVEWPTDPSAVG
jgi:putative transposase